MNEIKNSPLSDTLRPEQLLEIAKDYEWQDLIVVGITSAGSFSIITSRMTEERLLWLAKWLEQYVLKGELLK